MAPCFSRSRHLSPALPVRPRVRAAAPFTLAVALSALLLCAGVLLWLGTAPAAAVPVDGKPIWLFGAVKSQVDSLTNQAGFVQSEIDALDTELERHTESYNELSIKLDQINVRMADLRRQLAQAQAKRADRVTMLEERIRAVYKSGGRDQLLQMILLSSGMDDLISRIRLVSVLAGQDHRLVDDLKVSTTELDTLLREIDTHKRDELSVRRQLDEQRAEIEAKLAERETALAGIGSQISAVIEQEKVRQAAEQEKLRQALLGLLNGGQRYDGPLPQTESAILNQFVETAATYMGIPYVWAGDRPSTGFDCSGFTRYIYAQHGVDLPHYSGYQAQMGIPVDLANIQPGDLVAFGFPVHHVGIYIGDGLFIHAPRTGDVVKISPLSEKTNLAAIRRFPLQPRIGAPTVR
jgi:cell wall-associated NlpC family hydrolase/Trp operon repressor